MKKKPSLESRPKTPSTDNRYILEPIKTVEGGIRMKKYAKIKVVGQGSYSKCFLVKNTESQSTYVVKIIPKRKLEVLQREKLIYEIKIHQSLSHPNVVHLDHWFEDEDYQYIFMEYCSKGNLENKVKEVSHLPEKQIKKYAFQIVKAIQYCHCQKILHRDLKLSNFYFDDDENIKLGDFGFACQLASEYDKKRQSCGTPNYIAPEAISGFGYSFSSDVWAIGVILFRLKYGICPFEGETVKKTLEKVRTCDYGFPKVPKISAELKDLIQSIFNINYDERLTTEEILNHKFFDSEEQNKKNREQKSPKKSFSLSRIFGGGSSKAEEKKQLSPKYSQRQGMMSRQSRAQSKKKEEPLKRYNSCETLKQIKEIFKSKSKQTLITTQGKEENSGNLSGLNSIYYNMSVTQNTMSSGPNNYTDYCPTLTAKSSKYNIIEYGFNGGMEYAQTNSSQIANTNNGSRVSRLNEFIKNQVTNLQTKISGKNKNQNPGQKIKTLINHEPTLNIKSSADNKLSSTKKGTHQKILSTDFSKSDYEDVAVKEKQKAGREKEKEKTKNVVSKNSHYSHQQSLFSISKKFYLPLEVQQQKDLTIVHYKPTLKQIIWPTIKKSFLLHRDTKKLYSMAGEIVSMEGLPKVFKYIIQNKIEIKPLEEDEFDLEAEKLPSVTQFLKFLPHSWIPTKDGIILKYQQGSLSVSVAKLYNHEEFFVVDSTGWSNSFIYLRKNAALQICEGVVLMKIYTGWAKGVLKI